MNYFPLPVRGLLWRILLCLATFSPTPTIAAETARERFLAYIEQPIVDTPLTRALLAEIDRAPLLTALDPVWLTQGRDSAQGRGQATYVGQMAFAYRTPGTRWHRHAPLRAQIIDAFRAFEQHQTEQGRFVWGEQAQYEYQAHEHVWRLEPLVLSYLWLAHELTPEQRVAWRQVIQRGGEYLLKHPLTEANNRGAVWAAGATLCGLALDDPRYEALVRQHAATIFGQLVAPSGEVIETQGGGGPDGNYSYVGVAYAWWYRRLANDKSLDVPLQRAARWFALYTSQAGDLLAPGSSTRKADTLGGIPGGLPLWITESRSEPYLATIATECASRMPASYGKGGIIASPLIWALLESRREDMPVTTPAWYQNHTQRYAWPVVDYCLISRGGYQTGVTLRSHFPLLGVQAWAARGQSALLHHDGRELARRSSAQIGDIDTAQLKLVRRNERVEALIWPTDDALQQGAELTTICYRQHDKSSQVVWTCIAFTPQTTVVAHGPVVDSARSAWSVAPQLISSAKLTNTAWITPQHGRIVIPEGSLSWNGSQLVATAPAPRHVVALSTSELNFESSMDDRAKLVFTDCSGRYSLDLHDVLNPTGELNRDVTARLTRIDR